MALNYSPVKAQAGGADVVVVRVTEGVRRVNVSITRPDGKSE